MLLVVNQIETKTSNYRLHDNPKIITINFLKQALQEMLIAFEL